MTSSAGGRGSSPGRTPRGAASRPAAAPARPPARVFWVRRLVVLGLPVLLVGLVAGLVLAPDDPTSSGPAPSAPAAAPAVTPTPTTTVDPVGGIGECAASALGLAISPTEASFARGVAASFTVTITNTGTLPCVVDAGETYREIVVTSGDDRVWSNRDCASADSDPRTLLLDRGQQDVTQLAWNRERSAAGCPAGLPTPGAGTYQVTFSLGGAVTGPSVFVLE